jgi:hypothetical protein
LNHLLAAVFQFVAEAFRSLSVATSLKPVEVLPALEAFLVHRIYNRQRGIVLRSLSAATSLKRDQGLDHAEDSRRVFFAAYLLRPH